MSILIIEDAAFLLETNLYILCIFLCSIFSARTAFPCGLTANRHAPCAAPTLWITLSTATALQQDIFNSTRLSPLRGMNVQLVVLNSMAIPHRSRMALQLDIFNSTRLSPPPPPLHGMAVQLVVLNSMAITPPPPPPPSAAE